MLNHILYLHIYLFAYNSTEQNFPDIFSYKFLFAQRIVGFLYPLQRFLVLLSLSFPLWFAIVTATTFVGNFSFMFVLSTFFLCLEFRHHRLLEFVLNSCFYICRLFLWCSGEWVTCSINRFACEEGLKSSLFKRRDYYVSANVYVDLQALIYI